MPVIRSGFVRFNGDKNANGIQGIKQKSALRFRNPSSFPLLAFEDKNGLSPVNSPTRWDQIHRIESEDSCIIDVPPSEEPIKMSPTRKDEECPPPNEQTVLKPIPVSLVPKNKEILSTAVQRRKSRSMVPVQDGENAQNKGLLRLRNARKNSNVVEWTPFSDHVKVKEHSSKALWMPTQDLHGPETATKITNSTGSSAREPKPLEGPATIENKPKLCDTTAEAAVKCTNGNEPIEHKVDKKWEDAEGPLWKMPEDSSMYFANKNDDFQQSFDNTRRLESLLFEDEKTPKGFFSPTWTENFKTPKELLSPVHFTKTAKCADDLKAQSSSLSEAKNPQLSDFGEVTGSNRTDSKVKNTDQKIINTQNRNQQAMENKSSLIQKLVEIAAPMIKNGSITEDQEEAIRRAAEQMGIELDDATISESGIPLSVEVKERRSSFHIARKQIKKAQSIHFKQGDSSSRRNPRRLSPSSNSLLDTDSDFNCDSVSDLHSASQSSDSLQHRRNRHFITVDTKSVNSEEISTLTYPHEIKDRTRDVEKKNTKTSKVTKRKAVSDRTTAHTVDITLTASESRDESACSRDIQPLGASVKEIELLNKFLTVAGPDFKESTLTSEAREKVHDTALRAGIPEGFINKILDQSAGIRRWDDASMASETSSLTGERGRCRQQLPLPNTPGESTYKSLRTKSTMSTMSSNSTQSTRYTRDSESISYYTYDDLTRRSPKTEVMAENTGCAGRLSTLFWMENNIAGQDMMENVTAALSRDGESIFSDDY